MKYHEHPTVENYYKQTEPEQIKKEYLPTYLQNEKLDRKNNTTHQLYNQKKNCQIFDPI